MSCSPPRGKPPPSLLVVAIDDDPGDLEILRRHLARVSDWRVDFRGFTVVEQGLAELSLGGVDVLFLDYRLGPDDGLSVLSYLDDNDLDVPTVLLTGYAKTKVAVEAMRIGAAEFLPKWDLSPRTVRDAVLTAIEEHRVRTAKADERRELTDAYRSLSRKSDEVRSFYQMLSHELKTPLTAAREFVSILYEGLAGPVTDQQQEYLAIARSCCDRIARYIDDLVDVARIETGKLTIQPSPTMLGPLVESIVVAATPSARSRGIDLSCGVERSVAHLVMNLDADRIHQALGNLITNAIKFCSNGDRIRVSVGPRAEGPGAVEVRVSDTGPGIEPEHLDRIFDRLFQSGSAASSGDDGLGLGLSICREIVHLHGGKVTVSSIPRVETTFTFDLPTPVAETTETAVIAGACAG